MVLILGITPIVPSFSCLLCDFINSLRVVSLTVRKSWFGHNEDCTWGERVTIFCKSRAEASPRDTKEALAYIFIIKLLCKEGAWQI